MSDDGGPVGAGIQVRASNHPVRLRSKDVVGSDKEKALLKVSGEFKGDECK